MLPAIYQSPAFVAAAAVLIIAAVRTSADFCPVTCEGCECFQVPQPDLGQLYGLICNNYTAFTLPRYIYLFTSFFGRASAEFSYHTLSVMLRVGVLSLLKLKFCNFYAYACQAKRVEREAHVQFHTRVKTVVEKRSFCIIVYLNFVDFVRSSTYNMHAF